ncbi:MAG: acetoacetate decarboxylase family protein [Chloroflexota bacterium]
MRFVKTADEIDNIQRIYSRCHQLGVKTLTVHFETEPDAVRALLPPPLEPAPAHVGVAWVTEVADSTCVGPYSASGLAIRAKYGDITGNYVLSSAITTTEAVTFGRELYGDPRKLAKVAFEQQGDHVWGHADRHDIRYLSMRGRCDSPAPAGRQEDTFFFFKFLPRADGSGFDSAPVLVQVTNDITVMEARRGRGELVFRDSPHDPVSDIPVHQVLDAIYTEGHAYTSGRILCEVDPGAFLPYAFSKNDAYEVIAEGTVMRAQASRRTSEGKGHWRKTA